MYCDSVVWLQFIAIGPTTDAALTERGLRVAAVATNPTPDDIKAAVLLACQATS